ncbi:uncharacterized protein N7515_006840 [Penicillium bovifimosum]|uniref:Uncharacterized protein n=1 Tax=Penicillium bovifimosum TaxID=126998 RepID=A0A9W9GVQ0_9EURO|nr:uncharacterized protein N7515_006840 [Penicillium bovifimosum]KAJ5130801.1 hypothetical protein N7515_006840 [Penicillium bovifimosum]
MPFPDIDHDIAPIPRSREENQERAFIAASRRKDRSLDARLESANRASMLHKKRTGKAFHITKEIVEKEAMYEEVDERYQEKRIRMLQDQNKQIEQQFNRHLLAALAARSYNSASSIHSRRSSHMTPRPSIDGGSSKMSLDLSNIRSSFSQGSGSQGQSHLASPMPTSDSYVLSPAASSFDQSGQSYMTCMDGSESSFSNMMTGPSGLPAYVGQNTPMWNTQAPAWSGMQQQIPTPGQTPTDANAVQAWQQQMMQQSQMPDTATQMRHFRDRLASAPELSLQHAAPPPLPSGSISGPTTGHGHSRGQSQPSNSFHNLQLLTQSTHLTGSHVAPSSVSSPKMEAQSADTHSTPDFCPTPNTPLSPTATMQAKMSPDDKAGGNGTMVSHEGLDPDFSDFSQFALHLGNSTVPLSDRDHQFVFDDYLNVNDDYTSVPC